MANLRMSRRTLGFSQPPILKPIGPLKSKIMTLWSQTLYQEKQESGVHLV